MRRAVPLGGGGEGLNGLARLPRSRRDAANEAAVADHGEAVHRLGGGELDRLQRRAVGLGPEHSSIEHALADDVGRIAGRTADDLPAGDLGDGCAEHFPFFDARQGDTIRRRVEPRFDSVSSGEVGQRDLLRAAREVAVGNLHGRTLDTEALGGVIGEPLAEGGGGFADAGDGGRGGAAAGGAAVVGAELGIGHDQADAVDRQTQFFCGGLRELRAGVLADFDLAREHGDRAILADVEAVGEILLASCGLPAAPPSGALGVGEVGRDRDGEPGPENLDKLAAVRAEGIGTALAELVAFDFGEFVVLSGHHAPPVQ